MTTVTGRRLQLLALRGSTPSVSAGELAERLEVTARTARRDVAALRELGYRIDSSPGRYGGYTLGPGDGPPLVLDAEETLAAALGLRAALGVSGLGPPAATALAKLTTTLPTRHRARLTAVATATATAASESDRQADPATFTALALACRAGQAVRLRHHRDDQHHPAPARSRDTQPHRLVIAAGRWYLIACDRGEATWRAYALERITDVRPLGIALHTPEPPGDPAALVTAALTPSRAGRRHHVRVRAHTSGDLVRQLTTSTTADVIDDENGCVIDLATDDLDWAARWLVHLNLDIDVLEPPALHHHLHDLGTWLTARYP